MHPFLRASSRAMRGVLVALAACALPAAHADCVDGVREARAGEAAFHERAMAALVAALPPIPRGAEATGTRYDFHQLPGLGVLCSDTKVGAFSPNVRRDYLLHLDEAESNRRRTQRRQIDDEIGAVLKLPPDQAAERDALDRKATAADYARSAAVKAGDKAAAEARLAEVQSLIAASKAITHRHLEAVKPQVDALNEKRKALSVDPQSAWVVLQINAARLPAAKGTIPMGSYGQASPQRSAALRVLNVVWVVNGEAGPLRDAVEASLDKARLQALVDKPLPTVAESQAAAQAAESGAASVVSAPTPSARPMAAGGAAVAPAPTPAGSLNATAAVPTPSVPSGDPMKGAVDAAQKLRGLFNR